MAALAAASLPLARRHLRTPPQVALAADSSIDAVAALSRAGAGLTLLPLHLAADGLAAGRLVAPLRESVAPGPEVRVRDARRTLAPARVRAAIGALVAGLPAALRVR